MWGDEVNFWGFMDAILKRRTATLANGQIVKEGDTVEFINSDGEVCRDKIKRDVNNPRRLFFWNNKFNIDDYKSAVRVDPTEQ